MTDGGNRIPSVAPATTEPSTSRSSYLARRISGTATWLMVATIATEEPDTDPSAAQAPMVAVASVPRRPLNMMLIDWNSSRAMPECLAIEPISTNSGTTERSYAEANVNGTWPSTSTAWVQPLSVA